MRIIRNVADRKSLEENEAMCLKVNNEATVMNHGNVEPEPSAPSTVQNEADGAEEKVEAQEAKARAKDKKKV